MMAAIQDGFPADTDPRALKVVADVERARQMGIEVVPLLKVHARRCGCRLGEVHRAHGLTVLAGTVLYSVPIGTVNGRYRYEDHRQPYAVPLDEPDRMVQFGCKHGGTATGELLGDTLARVRAAVAGATRRGETLHV